MEIHLKIVGIVLLILAIMHGAFPRYFEWRKDLQYISLINKQMMYVHTFFVSIIIFLMGILCFFCSHDLINTRLGKNLILGLFIFWAIRLLFQFFVYSSILWKGKRFETAMHVVFSILWTYLTFVFLIIYLS